MAKQIGIAAFGAAEKAEFSCVATDARIPSLTGGKIDLIIATLGKTPPREQVIDYSDIYYWGSSNVIVPKDSPVQKLADLEGKSMLIIKGGSQLKWLRERIPGIQFVQLNTNADNIQALVQGRADGYVGDAVTISTLLSNYPNLRVIKEEVDLGFNGSRHPQERARTQGLCECRPEEDEKGEILLKSRCRTTSRIRLSSKR